MRLLERSGFVALLSFALIRACLGASNMAQTMQMDDAGRVGKVWLDQLEWRSAQPNEAAWQGEGWYGDDYNKAWLRSEGDATSSRTQDARAEVFGITSLRAGGVWKPARARISVSGLRAAGRRSESAGLPRWALMWKLPSMRAAPAHRGAAQS